MENAKPVVSQSPKEKNYFSGFLVFLRECSDYIRKFYPQVPHADVMKVVGVQWQTMPLELQERYVAASKIHQKKAKGTKRKYNMAKCPKERVTSTATATTSAAPANAEKYEKRKKESPKFSGYYEYMKKWRTMTTESKLLYNKAATFQKNEYIRKSTTFDENDILESGSNQKDDPFLNTLNDCNSSNIVGTSTASGALEEVQESQIEIDEEFEIEHVQDFEVEAVPEYHVGNIQEYQVVDAHVEAQPSQIDLAVQESQIENVKEQIEDVQQLQIDNVQVDQIVTIQESQNDIQDAQIIDLSPRVSTSNREGDISSIFSKKFLDSNNARELLQKNVVQAKVDAQNKNSALLQKIGMSYLRMENLKAELSLAKIHGEQLARGQSDLFRSVSSVYRTGSVPQEQPNHAGTSTQR